MKRFNDIPHFDYLFITMLGFWGAVMNFLHRDREDMSMKRKIALFITDIITSGGIAVTVYLTLVGYTDNAVLSAGVAGILAHQGAEAFRLISEIAIAVVEQKLKIKIKDEDKQWGKIEKAN